MAVYGAMGLKEGFVGTKKIGELIENIKIDGELVEIKPFKKISLTEGMKKLQNFEFNDLSSSVTARSFEDCQNLLAININSFMGGAKDLYIKGRDTGQFSHVCEDSEVSHSDGKIELVSF